MFKDLWSIYYDIIIIYLVITYAYELLLQTLNKNDNE